MKLVLAILIIFSSFFAHSEEEVVDSTKIWVAPSLSLFVGLGVGVCVQGNCNNRGLIYGTADLTGFYFVWKSITDCHSPTSHDPDCPNDKNRKIARGLFLTSRVAQVLDSVIWSFNNYGKYQSSAFILPKDDGLSMNMAFQF